MPIFSIWKSFANRSCRKNYGPSRYETLKAQTTLKGINYVTYFKDYVTFSEVNRINIVSQFFSKLKITSVALFLNLNLYNIIIQ